MPVCSVTLVLVYVTGGLISGRANLALAVLRQNFIPRIIQLFHNLHDYFASRYLHGNILQD
jgi:hypothetical protein